MSDKKPDVHPFISYLVSLAEAEDRGRLAALRRGLGQPPGAAVEMYRYVVPWLPNNASRNQEAAYYLVASLFAFHPRSTGEGNMGSHLAKTRDPKGDEALERRFTTLLAAHLEDLPTYLRQAVGYLKSKEEVPVNWNQLLSDLQFWGRADRLVQKRWAEAFWDRAQG